MPSDEFWNLTWYDWGLWIERIRELRERRLQDIEYGFERARSIMALLANINRDKKQRAMPYQGSDFFKLSYDTKVVQEADPDLMDRLKKRFGSKIKKRG